MKVRDLLPIISALLMWINITPSQAVRMSLATTAKAKTNSVKLVQVAPRSQAHLGTSTNSKIPAQAVLSNDASAASLNKRATVSHQQHHLDDEDGIEEDGDGESNGLARRSIAPHSNEAEDDVDEDEHLNHLEKRDHIAHPDGDDDLDDNEHLNDIEKRDHIAHPDGDDDDLDDDEHLNDLKKRDHMARADGDDDVDEDEHLNDLEKRDHIAHPDGDDDLDEDEHLNDLEKRDHMAHPDGDDDLDDDDEHVHDLKKRENEPDINFTKKENQITGPSPQSDSNVKQHVKRSTESQSAIINQNDPSQNNGQLSKRNIKEGFMKPTESTEAALTSTETKEKESTKQKESTETALTSTETKVEGKEYPIVHEQILKDVTDLQNIFSHWRTKKQDLYRLLAYRTPDQVQAIREMYRKIYNKALPTRIKKVRGALRMFMLGLVRYSTENAVVDIRRMLRSFMVNSASKLIHLLVLRPNSVLEAIRAKFRSSFKLPLSTAIKRKISGLHKWVYLTLIKGRETTPSSTVEEDATRLHSSLLVVGKRRPRVVINILCSRPLDHLRKVFAMVNERYSMTIHRMLKKSHILLGGPKKALMHVVDSINNPVNYIANQFRIALAFNRFQKQHFFRLMLRYFRFLPFEDRDIRDQIAERFLKIRRRSLMERIRDKMVGKLGTGKFGYYAVRAVFNAFRKDEAPKTRIEDVNILNNY